jgi:hypothetical protein
MGYSYGRGGLCCDKCGGEGSTRKRHCRYQVTSKGVQPLPYCYPPALCPPCYAAEGGMAGVHGARCKDGAAAAQRADDVVVARLKAGEYQVAAAWGDWDKDTPAGMVRVIARTWGGGEAQFVMPAADYKSGGFVSDYPAAVPLDEYDGVAGCRQGSVRLRHPLHGDAMASTA